MGMETGYSLADLAAVTDGKRDEGMMGGGMWIFFLFILLLFSGGGLGGFGNTGGAANMVNNDFIYTNLKSSLDGLAAQASANQRDILTGFHGVDNAVCTIGHQATVNTSNILQTMNQQFAQVDNAVCTLGFQTAQGINAVQRDIADCCCTTNRNIDAVRFEAERNSMNIVNAIHSDGDATRALINANTMQDLRDKLQDQKFTNSQIVQTAQIREMIIPKLPVPAYIQPSPYAAYGHQRGCCDSGCGGF